MCPIKQTKQTNDLAQKNCPANEFYESLKSQCIAVKVSYEERVAMREEEIRSLKEALDILNASTSQAQLGL